MHKTKNDKFSKNDKFYEDAVVHDVRRGRPQSTTSRWTSGKGMQGTEGLVPWSIDETCSDDHADASQVSSTDA